MSLAVNLLIYVSPTGSASLADLVQVLKAKTGKRMFIARDKSVGGKWIKEQRNGIEARIIR